MTVASAPTTFVPEAGIVEVSGLSKRFGPVHAVSDLSFTVEPGRVTGFLGPNGAGKTTTLRMLLNLVAPTAGAATIGGRRYARPNRPAALGGRGAGGVQRAQGSHRRRPPAGDLRGGRAARADEVLGWSGSATPRPAHRRLLDGHAAAARSGRDDARRPAGAPPRRAGERPRPGGDPVDAPVPARWRRRAAGAGVEPPALGGRAARRRCGHRRGRQLVPPRPSTRSTRWATASGSAAGRPRLGRARGRGAAGRAPVRQSDDHGPLRSAPARRSGRTLAADCSCMS